MVKLELGSSVSSAGGSQKVVRKESADTQEYAWCQQNDVNDSGQWDDMDVDLNENTWKS